jgi:hypothetical protein
MVTKTLRKEPEGREDCRSGSGIPGRDARGEKSKLYLEVYK